MKFMNQAFGEFHKFHMTDHECKIVFITGPLNMGFYHLQNVLISIRKYIADIVIDTTYMHQNVITCVVIPFL